MMQTDSPPPTKVRVRRALRDPLEPVGQHLPRIEAYLDVLERAMLDRYLSAHEEEALIEVAVDLGLQRDQLAALHATYLDSLAIAAWEDGVVTAEETQQLTAVASMLGLPGRLVHVAVERAQHARGRDGASDFRLSVGDQVVFTGELSIARDEWVSLAQRAGLRHGGGQQGDSACGRSRPGLTERQGCEGAHR
ncbi:MAG: hypothetical protein ACR2KL_04400 [Nocardioidaceae bacterium]